ncbi:FkbM family methyltransferase [Spirochaetia bacterium 38H-sp]|uniref:FkbM family methyltransferase n=1 Tax=Rarispira pelagica TaxID=3141764 RepID=A0ABU9UAH2_9SPIR
MMFVKMAYIKRKIRGLAWRVFNMLENNGNCNFEQNGEKLFIENLFEHFKNKDGREKIVFDIGANIGEYSSMLSEYSLKNNIDIELHLFEPTKSCFQVLEKKFKDKDNVHLNHFGVSNKSEMATIFYDKETSGFASLYKRNLYVYNVDLGKKEDVFLKRMDEYIEQNNILHIDFVKIDIEGHELRAFEGFGKYLSGDYIDFIQFEYGGANLDSHTSLMEIYDFLESRKFEIAKVMPKGLEFRKYEPFMENFQYANYVAVSKAKF